jgi:hypothetical protein
MPSLGGRFINASGAWRGGVANARLEAVFGSLKIESTNAPRSQPSSPANGSAEWPPDDRLRRAIQYSKAPVMESRSRGVLDTPLSRSMTVSARSGATKQSIFSLRGKMDCFAALAMTALHLNRLWLFEN